MSALARRARPVAPPLPVILPVILPALLAAVSLPLVLSGCAKEEPPPGTAPDSQPPRSMELRPEYGAAVPGFDGSASIRFDEPLANPRNLGRDLVGSPAGRYETRPKRSGLDVRPADGWREGVVYYLSLPAGISDLLRNQTTRPVEWLFSTGGEVPETEVSGRLIDRVTARGMQGLRVLFLSGDSIPYTAVSDTGGVYRLPGLPPGDYEAVAFQDQDRDFVYDAEFEPGGVEPFTIGPDAPNPEVDVLVLPADSTAPVLLTANARDSLTVRLEFDDPLDPEADSAGITVAVRDSASGEELAIDTFAVGDLEPLAPPALPVEEGAEVDEGDEGEAIEGEIEGEPDEAGEDEPVEPGEDAEVAAVAEDEALVEAPPGEIQGLEPAPNYVIVRLAAPLTARTYTAEVSGVANLRALEGGGTRSFVYEPPPPPEVPGEQGVGEEVPGEEGAGPGEEAGEDAP